MCMFMYTTLTFITETFVLLLKYSIAAFNDCYSELTTYTALAFSYWIGFHDVY